MSVGLLVCWLVRRKTQFEFLALRLFSLSKLALIDSHEDDDEQDDDDDEEEEDNDEKDDDEEDDIFQKNIFFNFFQFFYCFQFFIFFR